MAILFCIIPPSLPMAMLFGVVWANIRLHRTHHIFCTNPKNIITCGSVNCVCFDKVYTNMSIYDCLNDTSRMF